MTAMAWQGGATGLMAAIERQNQKEGVIQLLIELKADVNAADEVYPLLKIQVPWFSSRPLLAPHC